jgi:integrase
VAPALRGRLLRPGELRALTWADVDLDPRLVHVTKAYDEKGKHVAEPKTSNGVRDIPIEPTLVPLLEHLRHPVTDLSAPVAPLLLVHDEQHRAKIFCGHLVKANVTRPRLTESTGSTMPVNFRSCHDSGITWLALAGVALPKVQRRVGHDDISTTLGCVFAGKEPRNRAEGGSRTARKALERRLLSKIRRLAILRSRRTTPLSMRTLVA